MSSSTGSFHKENVENLPPSTLLCTANISTQKEIASSKVKQNGYLKQRGRRRKWWYFNRSLQPISEACEIKDEPTLTEPKNTITNDSNILNDDFQNVKNQSFNSEKSDIIGGGIDQPIFKDSYSPCLKVIEKFQEIVMDSAVRVIQAAFKRFRERRRFLRIKKAVMVIQRNLRKWIQARQCLRPAEFHRQSSDGAKSDDYRESEEKNLESDNDNSDVEESHKENDNEEAKVDSPSNSNTNSHENTHEQLNHDIDNPTQEFILNNSENSNQSSEISQSYSDPVKLDDSNNQDSTEPHSDANATLQDPTPDILLHGQKKVHHETISDSCAVCEGTQQQTTEAGSQDECDYSSSIQLSNEGMSAENAATIVLEETIGHQQEYRECMLSHDGKTHGELNEDCEQILQHEKQCEHVPHGLYTLNTETNNQDLTTENGLKIVTSKAQVTDDYEEVKQSVETNKDNGCIQEPNINSEVEHCCVVMDKVSEIQENTIINMLLDSDSSMHEKGSASEHDLECLQTNGDEGTNSLESDGTINQDNAGCDKSLYPGNVSENINTDNDINLNNIKV